MSKPFSVNLWGSHPDQENDDCWTGDEFATEAEARACFADPWGVGGLCSKASTEYIELDGPGVYEIRRNPGFVPSNGRDDLWANERRMQAAMMGEY